MSRKATGRCLNWRSQKHSDRQSHKLVLHNGGKKKQQHRKDVHYCIVLNHLTPISPVQSIISPDEGNRPKQSRSEKKARKVW